MSPPEELVLTNSNAGHKNVKEDCVLPLMFDNVVFAHGDNGGVIIRYQNDNADEPAGNVDDILRDLQGADLSNSEVRALWIVELLTGLKKDDVGGDFFIYLMQELTNIISDFSDDMNNTNSGGTVPFNSMLICFHRYFTSDVPFQNVENVESDLYKQCKLLCASFYKKEEFEMRSRVGVIDFWVVNLYS